MFEHPESSLQYSLLKLVVPYPTKYVDNYGTLHPDFSPITESMAFKCMCHLPKLQLICNDTLGVQD